MEEQNSFVEYAKARYLRDKTSIDHSYNDEIKAIAYQRAGKVAEILEDNFLKIKGEYAAFDKSLLQLVPEDDVHNKKLWRFFPIFLNNNPIHTTVNGIRRCNKDYFTNTHEIVSSYPGVIAASLSTIGPRCVLNAHTGYTNNFPHNCVIRLHLPISVYSEAYDECGMNVYESKDEPGYGDPVTEPTMKVSWKEGKVIMFDDSHKHWVWNKTDKSRTVLMVDYFVDSFMSKRLRIWNHYTDKEAPVKECALNFINTIADDYAKTYNG